MLQRFHSMGLDPNNPINMETTPLAACDACYSRKIRCDRGDPCANCQDSRARCLRKRQKQARKPRDVDLENAIKEIKASVSNVQSSVGHLLSTTASTSNQEPNSISNRQSSLTPTSDSGRLGTELHYRKRTSTAAFESENSGGLLPGRITSSKRASSPRTPIESPYSPPPFSTSEAQTLILRELANGTGLSAKKRSIFQTALSALSQSLQRGQNEIDDEPSPWSFPENKSLLENPSLPPASLIQWMLQTRGKTFFSVPDSLPLVSRQTILRMSRSLLESNNPREDIASLVCIESCASYFLFEHVTQWGSDFKPDDPLHRELETYFDTARAAIPHLSLLGPPSLANLQALQFGAINATEIGDIEAAWRFTSAASTICYALDLHKKNNSFMGDRSHEAIEAFTCFGFTYMQDKGLAMNLGRPACLQDTYIEEEAFERSIQQEKRPNLFYQYINLARVQSRVIIDLHSAGRSSLLDINAVVTDILGTMDSLWQSMQEFRKTPMDMGSKLDNEIDFAMYDFAFYSIKTVLLHSGSEKSRNAKLAGACISSARSSFAEVNHIKELCNKHKLSIDGVISLGNWSVLYYPFTPFFVLFCNVVSTGNQGDHTLMEQFVNYLSEMTDVSPPIAKLHKLCVPFLYLATNILESTEGTASSANDNTVTPRSSIEQAATTIPGTNTFQAFPPPVPQLSISDQMPIISDSVVRDSATPPGFPSFTSVPADDVFWQLMDAQPRLQWLDSDFSRFEQTWGDGGFGDQQFPG